MSLGAHVTILAPAVFGDCISLNKRLLTPNSSRSLDLSSPNPSFLWRQTGRPCRAPTLQISFTMKQDFSLYFNKHTSHIDDPQGPSAAPHMRL